MTTALTGLTDPLAKYREGLVIEPAHVGEAAHPSPLASTGIDVWIRGGFATVETIRTFRNTEPGAIEATLTFPVPIDAVLHGLKIAIDGRELVALAQARGAAREAYEDAVDAGKAAVLHEEVLRGVHMVSVGQFAPGSTCVVTSTWSTVTAAALGHARSLRIPTTVGAIYGRLPLNPADDLLTGALHAKACLRVRCADGTATVLGETLTATATGNDREIVLAGDVDLGHAIDIIITGALSAPLEGRSADGRPVRLEIAPETVGEAPLDLAVLFDRSGSTDAAVRADGNATVWSTTRDAVKSLLASLRDEDAITLYEFDDTSRIIGTGRGALAAELVERLGAPRGGTEIGLAIETALARGATDIVLLTDGQSGALDVQALAARGARISALLVGPASLEAMVGHLAASTGGQVACSSGNDAAQRLMALAGALRTPGRPATAAITTVLPQTLEEVRGGSRVTVAWGDTTKGQGAADAVGAYGAALAIPRMTERAATAVAIAHGLCTHLTSLVVVDEEGAVQDAIPATRKIALPRPYAGPILAAGVPPTVQTRSRSAVQIQPAPRLAASAASAPRAPSAAVSLLELHGAGLGIDWSERATPLAAGRLDGLDPSHRVVLEAAAAMANIAALARASGIPAVAIAAAVAAMAAAGNNRSAARLVRKIEAAIGRQAFTRLVETFGNVAAAQ